MGILTCWRKYGQPRGPPRRVVRIRWKPSGCRGGSRRRSPSCGPSRRFWFYVSSEAIASRRSAIYLILGSGYSDVSPCPFKHAPTKAGRLFGLSSPQRASQLPSPALLADGTHLVL